MRRNLENLEEYRESCKKVIKRADNRCECLVDDEQNCFSEEKKHRCFKYIRDEDVTYTNFLHKETRNGKSDEWILSPDNIIFGCAQHHLDEGRTGLHVESVKYEEGELNYIPED